MENTNPTSQESASSKKKPIILLIIIALIAGIAAWLFASGNMFKGSFIGDLTLTGSWDGKKVNLSWTDTKSANKYIVYKREKGQGKEKNYGIALINGKKNTFSYKTSHMAVKLGKTYIFSLSRNVINKMNPDSADLEIEIPMPQNMGSATLTGSYLDSKNTISLEWQNQTTNEYETQYYLLRKFEGNTQTFQKTFPANTNKYTDTKIEKGKTYRYTIEVTKQYGLIIPSNPIEIPAALQIPEVFQTPQLSFKTKENAVQLIWTDETNPSLIKHYEITKTGGSNNGPFTVGPETKEYTDENAGYGEIAYSIKTIGIKSEKVEAASNEIKILNPPPKSAFKNPILSITLIDDKPFLSWLDETPPEYIQGYRLLKSNQQISTTPEGTSNIVTYLPIEIGKNFNFKDTGIFSEKKYYLLKSISIGGGEGAESNEVSIEPLKPAKLSIPPEELILTANKPITLTWEDETSLEFIENYEIWVSKKPNIELFPKFGGEESNIGYWIGNVSPPEKTFAVDTNMASISTLVAPGEKLYFVVKTRWKNYQQILSNEIEIKMSGEEPHISTSAAANESGQIEIKWTTENMPETPVVSYNIYRNDMEEKIGSIDAPDNKGTLPEKYIDATAAEGQKYTYRVKAVFEDGTSLESAWTKPLEWGAILPSSSSGMSDAPPPTPPEPAPEGP